jgi:hypothetical protein
MPILDNSLACWPSEERETSQLTGAAPAHMPLRRQPSQGPKFQSWSTTTIFATTDRPIRCASSEPACSRLQHRVRVDRQVSDGVLHPRQLVSHLQVAEPGRLLDLHELQVSRHARARIEPE